MYNARNRGAQRDAEHEQSGLLPAALRALRSSYDDIFPDRSVSNAKKSI